jgi:DNA-directed RNA polymerase II subunit RPB2
MTEPDGTTINMFPQEARLRNLTYAAPLYVDMKKTVMTNGGVDDPIEADWQPVMDDTGGFKDAEDNKVWIGKVCNEVGSADTRFPSCYGQTFVFSMV